MYNFKSSSLLFGILEDVTEPDMNTDYAKYADRKVGKRLSRKELALYFNFIPLDMDFGYNELGAPVFGKITTFDASHIERRFEFLDDLSDSLLPPESAGLLARRLEPWKDRTEENIPDLIALLKRAADEGKYVIVFGS